MQVPEFDLLPPLAVKCTLFARLNSLSGTILQDVIQLKLVLSWAFWIFVRSSQYPRVVIYNNLIPDFNPTIYLTHVRFMDFICLYPIYISAFS